MREYVRGKLADLKDKKASFETENWDSISRKLYERYGYIQVDGEWIAKNSFIASKLRKRTENLKEKLKNAKPVKVLWYEGGSGMRGKYCQAFQHHGFVGIEEKVVADIMAWIKTPTP